MVFSTELLDFLVSRQLVDKFRENQGEGSSERINMRWTALVINTK